MTADGYDVVSYSAVLPTMLADSGWGLTVPQSGLIGSLTPVGMLVGAMVLRAIAPGVTLFGIGRVLVGFGVGGVVPSITALVFEYSAPQRRNVNTAVAFAGIDARRWAARLGIDPEPGPEPEPTGAAVAGRITAVFTGGRAG
jgi:AAHS family benzoate transporter-like MFS transporter